MHPFKREKAHMGGFLLPTEKLRIVWQDMQELDSRSYKCGYCSTVVSSDRGYAAMAMDSGDVRRTPLHYVLYICPGCSKPTFFDQERQPTPGETLGQPVAHVPETLNALYEEARRCSTYRCYTAAVMLCRKMLMHIAVEKKAAPGKTFVEYVDYLCDNHYVPPGSQEWVNRIRTKGNDANHEIFNMNHDDAKQILMFTEMLLTLIYAFPSSL